MYHISVEKAFRASHSLTLQGTPEPIHHHDWLIEVTIAAQTLDNQGLVMDFTLLQSLLDKIIQPLRQAPTLNDFEPLSPNPSAERLAEYLYRRLQQELSNDVNLVRVAVQEAPGCRAAYSE
ncbi:MAG: 6-carboxytetrahydropterin synthase [Sedimentisphaerales bacterium]|nr:6-carboxytetrahydropterin synthase [Sedimentisphaerales bacterium]